MAAAQQLLGEVQNQQVAPYPIWTDKPLFDDVPTPEGKVKLNKALQKAHGISRGGSSIGANLEGNDPGAGGGGNGGSYQNSTEATNGTNGLGGGGGGATGYISNTAGANGGSGVVIVRYAV